LFGNQEDVDEEMSGKVEDRGEEDMSENQEDDELEKTSR